MEAVFVAEFGGESPCDGDETVNGLHCNGVGNGVTATENEF